MLLQFPLAMVRVFTSYFRGILTMSALLQFAQVTSNIIEALVSINRLSAFLNADELQPDARYISKAKPTLDVGDEVRFLFTCTGWTATKC